MAAATVSCVELWNWFVVSQLIEVENFNFGFDLIWPKNYFRLGWENPHFYLFSSFFLRSHLTFQTFQTLRSPDRLITNETNGLSNFSFRFATKWKILASPQKRTLKKIIGRREKTWEKYEYLEIWKSNRKVRFE